VRVVIARNDGKSAEMSANDDAQGEKEKREDIMPPCLVGCKDGAKVKKSTFWTCLHICGVDNLP
jgi:hypothetical protein